ncbi:MAG: thrombospondin type-1 domain-containing protein [Patescibacteria group bacterium]
MAKTPKLVLFLVALLLAFPALATTEFTANSDITVDAVTFGGTTADMLIKDTSTAESWIYSGGAFTVTNPGTFMVSSAVAESTVKGIKVTNLAGDTVACAKNSTPGTSYVTLPTTADTYTITPIEKNISNSLTYNSTCGAATCASGYTVTGTGVNADCAGQASGGSPGGSTTTITPAAPVTCTSWTYSSWGTCSASGQQTRTIVSSSPSGCTGGSPAISQSCTPTTTTTPEETTAETPTTTTTPAATAEKISTTAGVPATDSAGKVTLEQMADDANTVATADVNHVIAEMGVSRDAAAEKTYNEGIVAKVVAGSSVTAEVRNAITNFVTYGTKATEVLGAGERAGVVNSFKAALGKLPTTEADWNDVIKIANGRWPSQISKAAEDKATINFKKVYLRDPNRTNAHDDAAVTVMAYGLRPADRNLNSEKAAIKSFKAIYGYTPSAATAWDVVRAIAYSGSKR